VTNHGVHEVEFTGGYGYPLPATAEAGPTSGRRDGDREVESAGGYGCSLPAIRSATPSRIRARPKVRAWVGLEAA
jgi:hypothetical protein